MVGFVWKSSEQFSKHFTKSYAKISSQNAQCNWEKIQQKSITKICKSFLGKKSAKLTELSRVLLYPGTVLTIRLGKGQFSQDF
jgi:hypothetical protein